MSAVAPPVEIETPRARFLSVGAADWAFAALLLLGAAIVFVETRGMSFFGDEWDFVIVRRGLSADTLLTPHGPHLVLFPILVWKVLLQVFGGGSYVPFRLLASFDLVITGLVLGVACRTRWGRWLGLAPVLLLVTLGPAGTTLLWPFEVQFTLSLVFGLLSLIALDRRGPWADATACLSLIVSLGSSSQGVGFVIAGALMVALGGNRLRRSWVVLLPALLYVVWYATYGHQHSQTSLSLWGESLSYMAQSLSATTGAVVGLSSVSTQTGLLDPTFGVPMVIALIAALAAAAWRGWRPQPIFLGSATTLLVIWFAASLSNGVVSRLPADPRYLSVNAVLLFVCICTATPKPRLARNGILVTLAVLAVIAATNADQFGQQHAAFVAGARQQRAELGALELMRGSVAPTYDPGVVDPNLVNITAGPFFSAQRAFRLTEDSVAQIRAQPEATRENVDRILGPNQLSLSPVATIVKSSVRRLRVLSGSPRRSRGCLIIGSTALELASPPGRVAITTPASLPSVVGAARFASDYVYGVGTVPPDSSAVVGIAADRATKVPWRFTLTGTGSRVCLSR